MTLAPTSAYDILKCKPLTTVILLSSLGRACVGVFTLILPSPLSSVTAHILNVSSGSDRLLVTHRPRSCCRDCPLSWIRAWSPITCVICHFEHWWQVVRKEKSEGSVPCFDLATCVSLLRCFLHGSHSLHSHAVCSTHSFGTCFIEGRRPWKGQASRWICIDWSRGQSCYSAESMKKKVKIAEFSFFFLVILYVLSVFVVDVCKDIGQLRGSSVPLIAGLGSINIHLYLQFISVNFLRCIQYLDMFVLSLLKP